MSTLENLKFKHAELKKKVNADPDNLRPVHNFMVEIMTARNNTTDPAELNRLNALRDYWGKHIEQAVSELPQSSSEIPANAQQNSKFLQLLTAIAIIIACILIYAFVQFGNDEPETMLVVPTATRLPTPTATAVWIAPTLIQHTVTSGETIVSIAQRYNTTAPIILAANGVTSIQPDQVLLIPRPELVLREDLNLVDNWRGVGTAVILIPKGTIVPVIARNNEGDWFFVHFTEDDRVYEGWLPASGIGLIYPASPATIPNLNEIRRP